VLMSEYPISQYLNIVHLTQPKFLIPTKKKQSWFLISNRKNHPS
jgi:hypothetical protein